MRPIPPSSFLFITVIMIWSQRRCAQRTRYATTATAATNDGNGKVYSHLFGPIIPAGSDEISCSITCHAFSVRGFRTPDPLHRWCTGFNNLLCSALLFKPSWITRNPSTSSSEMGPNAGTGISVTSYERPYPRICNASRIVKCR